MIQNVLDISKEKVKGPLKLKPVLPLKRRRMPICENGIKPVVCLARKGIVTVIVHSDNMESNVQEARNGLIYLSAHLSHEFLRDVWKGFGACS